MAHPWKKELIRSYIIWSEPLLFDGLLCSTKWTALHSAVNHWASPAAFQHHFFYRSIVHEGVPAPPPFLKQNFLNQPLDPACPLFKIIASQAIFSVPPPFKVFYTVPTTQWQPPPALIQPTNLPWFKQISEGWFY